MDQIRCPHAAHNAEIARLTTELAAEHDRAEWLTEKLIEVDRKLDAARGAIESLRGLQAIAEAERDLARADAQIYKEALSNACYLSARLTAERDQTWAVIAAAWTYARGQAPGDYLYDALVAHGAALEETVGAPLLALRDAVRAYLDRLDMHDADPMHVYLDDDTTLALERALRAALEEAGR